VLVVERHNLPLAAARIVIRRQEASSTSFSSATWLQPSTPRAGGDASAPTARFSARRPVVTRIPTGSSCPDTRSEAGGGPCSSKPGGHDRRAVSYAARLYLPTNAPGEHYHHIGLMVSFLVPYYIVYSLRNVDDLDKIAKMKARSVTPSRHVNININNTLVILPAWMVKLVKLVKPELVEPSPMEAKATRQAISFDLSPDEQSYGAWIA
jgi:hypothetical protein